MIDKCLLKVKSRYQKNVTLVHILPQFDRFHKIFKKTAKNTLLFLQKESIMFYTVSDRFFGGISRMKKTALLIVISLLLTAILSMASYLAVFLHAHTFAYDELNFEEYNFEGTVFSITVSADTNGEYLYEIRTSQGGEPGELELIFRGGKQASRAQNPGEASAFFEIQVPDGVTRIVCGGVTVYTIE